MFNGWEKAFEKLYSFIIFMKKKENTSQPKNRRELPQQPDKEHLCKSCN